MKNVVILGSTGSLGTQTLEVLKKYRKYFKIIGLSANTKKKLLSQQAKKFKIKNIILASRDGEKAIEKLATLKKADIIINVLSGISGIKPSLAAIKADKILILGNKESLFVEGEKIIELTKKQFFKHNSKLTSKQTAPYLLNFRLILLDSEHNAIFEIIQKIYNETKIKNQPFPKIKKIILPCSGGPFYGKSKNFLKKITIAEALNHPHYKMGKKISIESATLLNKGLEIIEAHHLFNLPFSKIETRLHPECKISGAVEFEFFEPVHAKTYAYFSRPDMREHIENALLRAVNQIALLPISNFRKCKTRQPAIIFPKRNIQLITAKSARTLKPLIPGPLSGIKIILTAYKKFKNNPAQLKNFLLHEQKTIQKFLNGKIKFLEIFNKLKK